MKKYKHPGSFRDPNSSVYMMKDNVERLFSPEGKEEFLHCEASGLFTDLVGRNLLLKYEKSINEQANLVIRSPIIPFVSYRSEWCFEQLRAAALLTLEIELTALKYECSLKDASSYNVQFQGVYPVFIDHGSFEPYKEGLPWVAYNQFCEHFLSPLLILARQDFAPNEISGTTTSGIKIDVASKLLPRLSINAFAHIHLQNRYLKKYSTPISLSKKLETKFISLKRRVSLVQSLYDCVESLKLKSNTTEWGGYYDFGGNNYVEVGHKSKSHIITDFIKKTKAKKVLDLGANDGKFSRVIALHCDYVVSTDYDRSAINSNYIQSIKNREANIQVGFLDVMNPTPAIGWANQERQSFIQRADFDLVMALALVHHLVVTEGVPIPKICEFFHSLTKKFLIVEVPGVNDSQVQILNRWGGRNKDLYSPEKFEYHFELQFKILEKRLVSDSERKIYLLEKL